LLSTENGEVVMMLEGLGIDIVEVVRIKKTLTKFGERFLQRVFTRQERDYCSRKAHPEQSFAARFAAKEAVLKAIGIGLSGGVRWTDVEVVNAQSGQPEVKLSRTLTEKIGKKKILLSISHTKELAIAQAALIENDE
jgi:holo-[acyl-carrier protein] synthase